MVVFMIWLGLGVTFAFGVVLLPSVANYPNVDQLPTMIILTVQSFVVAVYLLYQNRAVTSKDGTESQERQQQKDDINSIEIDDNS